MSKDEQIKELEFKYNCVARQYNHLLQYIKNILELAKKNSDAYEYCLKGLEDKVKGLTNQNKILKERLKKVKDIGFWDENGNYKEDYQIIHKNELPR